MITTGKKILAATMVAAAVFCLPLFFHFTAGAEKQPLSKKQRGVISIQEIKQLSLQQENNLKLTVRGLYGGSNAMEVLLKSPAVESEIRCSISCALDEAGMMALKDIPLESELVLTGNLVFNNGVAELRNCFLISINIHETAGAF